MTRIYVTVQTKGEVASRLRTDAQVRINEILDLVKQNYHTKERAAQLIKEVTFDLDQKLRQLDRVDYIDV
jgi:hypothetical protein